MPVEIRELVIRAVVSPTNQSSANMAESDRQKLDVVIDACVRQVLRILRKEKDR